MRVSWDQYFIDIAIAVATRATCSRKHVGAVIVRDKTILSTGYNGSIRGMDHCDEVGHLMEDWHCVRTIHAEANAILQAAKNGTAIDGATLYSTASPCWPCFGLVANSGIRRIVFGEAYRATDPGPKRVAEVAKLAGIELVDFTMSQAELKAAHVGGPPVDKDGPCCDVCWTPGECDEHGSCECHAKHRAAIDEGAPPEDPRLSCPGCRAHRRFCLCHVDTQRGRRV